MDRGITSELVGEGDACYAGTLPVQNGLYKHVATGKLYQVLGVALSVSTLSPVVVYQSLYGDFGLWTRDYTDFNQKFSYENKTHFLTRDERSKNLVIKTKSERLEK